MKRYFKSVLMTTAALCAVALAGCEGDDIVAGKQINTAPYATLGQTRGHLLDGNTNLAANVAQVYSDGYTTTLRLGLTRAASAALNATVKVDAAWLTTYNAAHSTNYALYPESGVVFADGGAMSIASGALESAPVAMTVKRVDGLEAGRNYAIPVAVTISGGDVAVGSEAGHCLYVVQDMTGVGNVDKGEGLPKGFVFFDNHNILNALSFELENGKLLWDVVCPFAANINYSTAEGRPYLSLNSEMNHMLNNRDLYVAPLQKRGAKVVLGLLGNHDMSGLAQLSDMGARDFAREIAATVYTYGLDGVCLDDEYSQVPDLNNPYFTTPSPAAGARLCYELKKAMPDKMVTVFEWGQLYVSRFPDEIEGMQLGEYIDMSVANYGSSSTTKGGVTKAKGSGASLEFALGYGPTTLASATYNLVSAENPEGYGWFMGFAPIPERYDTAVFPRLYAGVEAIYGSKLKAPTVFYKKNDPKAYLYPAADGKY